MPCRTAQIQGPRTDLIPKNLYLHPNPMHSVLELLEQAASATSTKKLIFHDETQTACLTYLELYTRAKENAYVLSRRNIVSPNQVIMLHLGTQFEYVMWFWSVLAAGAIPVVSTPPPADDSAREAHLRQLRSLLREPIVLTTSFLASDLDIMDDQNIIRIETFASLFKSSSEQELENYTALQDSLRSVDNPVAFMMLTSGSTGGAKAVEISHAQAVAAIHGKIQMLGTSKSDVLLNWIGFDHVACVTETHLHAMAVGATQVHLAPNMTIRKPLTWLEKLAEHSATMSFAPNFFLASICKAVDSEVTRPKLDLYNLRVVVSGGEANTVSTGMAFNKLARDMGAITNVLWPAFGMTESCAGSIYNANFPALELEANLEFCSLGRSTHTMQVRITDSNGKELHPGQIGNLELNGPAVFQSYHNDPKNTSLSFTTDGWFKTGDTGYVDSNGNLVLKGRTKDSMIINGIKYFSHELESVIEEATGEAIVPSNTSAFSTWPKGSDSEEIVIIVSTREGDSDDGLLVATLGKIAETTLRYCSKRPKVIIPLPSELLCKSSLGKLSRSALKLAYEAGKYDAYIAETTMRVSAYRRVTRLPPATDMEKTLAKVFAAEFGLDIGEIGLQTSLADVGIDSIRLLRFKGIVQEELELETEISIGMLLANPSIQSLSKALSSGFQPRAYNPVVVLQSGESSSPPIWFIHPGLGEVLVFLNISKYFSDRQVYALRAPGFNHGEVMFSSIDQMTDIYMKSIRERQPTGPYILIGYSFGSMIAFETGKKFEAAGHTVGFLGSLNGPPHIKWRMVQIDWCELFLNLIYFLGFITEEEAVERSFEYHKNNYSKEKVLEKIMEIATPEKLVELDLTSKKLARWADISAQLQGLAHNYDPVGTVQRIDVFFANPLLAVGRDKEVWLREHLWAWNAFSRDTVCFHDSPGAHYTMLSPEHVFVMQKVLRLALKARGML